MKRRHFYSCLLSAGLAISLVSCSEDTTVLQGQERNVTMTVNISRGSDATRSILSEEEGDLKCVWEAGDFVLVTDKAGNKLGILALKNGAGQTDATFTGEITTEVTGETELNFIYLGKKSETELSQLSGPVSIDYSSQTGTLEWLQENDFFLGSQMVDIANSWANVEKVDLTRKIAFGKFELQLPEGVTYGGEEITISGDGVYTKASINLTDGGVGFSENGLITISPSEDTRSKAFYLTVLPKAGEGITPTFSVEIDGTTYSTTLSERLWAESEFVRKVNEDGSTSGVLLDMKAPSVSEDDGTVGPTISIDGKNYRFVRGNLYYNMTDGSWNIYEKETYFATLAGTSSPYSKQINNNSVSATNNIIDLFAWGATGLGESTSDGRAKTPDLIRQGWAGETTWAGSNWPSYNTGTMDVNGNANITDLWGSYTYNPAIYDFGYAYMQNGRPEGDGRTYVTAPLAAYAYILDQERSFTQGCIVKGAGMNGEDVKGALIILGVTDAASAKAKIESVGGSAPSLKKLNVSVNNAGFDFQITLPNYASIEKLDAMFFALAGSSNWSSKQQLSKDCGNYWTKDGAKGSSTDANAYSFFFRKSNTASECHWVVGRNGVSKTRRTQNSVRLMVEVDD